MKVEISNKTVEFIKNFCHELKIQDCRGTASPYFYVVKCEKDEVRPVGHGCAEAWRHPEICETFTEEELIEYCEENHIDPEEFKEQCYNFDLDKGYVDENVFFTERGYDEHIKLNGHNYRHYNKFYSYIKYANRNPEIENLLNAIKEIGDTINRE